MTRPPKNVAESIRARLAQRARDRGEDFQLVLTRSTRVRGFIPRAGDAA